MQETMLEINHGDTFVPPREPISERILTEKVTNSRSNVLTLVTDQEMLRPLPAPPTRIGQWQYAFTDGPVEIFDPIADGAKVDAKVGFTIDELQDQRAIDSWQLNTLRVEAEPWDERLIG